MKPSCEHEKKFKSGLCFGCYTKWQREKERARKKALSEKLKEKKLREKERNLKKKDNKGIKESTLDSIFSTLVKLAYPPICHSTGVSLFNQSVDCAHLIPRDRRVMRFDIRNAYPTLSTENRHNSAHVVKLAQHLKEYYGIEFDDWNALSKKTVRITPKERKEMSIVFREYIRRFQEIEDEEKHELRLELITKTSKI